MMQKPFISFIVPVYNVEAYLHQCVDSIINQTSGDWELILIDDGSCDGCPQICDEYAWQDNRIKVIHQSNQGVAVARNVGLDVATGEWIWFVDSDDWIESEAVSILKSNYIQSGGPDLIMFGFTRNSEEEEVMYEQKNQNLKKADFFNEHICFHNQRILFRRDIVESIWRNQI